MLKLKSKNKNVLMVSNKKGKKINQKPCVADLKKLNENNTCCVHYLKQTSLSMLSWQFCTF